MNKFVLLLFSLILTQLTFAQENSLSEWKSVMTTLKLSQAQINEVAPNFPKISDFASSADLNKVVNNWRVKNNSEWTLLNEMYKITDQFSPVYLGLYTSEEFAQAQNNKFSNGWVDWIAASNLSDRRLNEIAPHFPKVPEGATKADQANFEQLVDKWRILYGHEYEALINAPELTALNPYYEGYVDVVIIPKFVRSLQTDEFPVYKNTGNEQFDAILFELNKQTWYFVYDPPAFKREYGFIPEFPASFDIDKYRQDVKDRIEINKQIEAGELDAQSDF